MWDSVIPLHPRPIFFISGKERHSLRGAALSQCHTAMRPAVRTNTHLSSLYHSWIFFRYWSSSLVCQPQGLTTIQQRISLHLAPPTLRRTTLRVTCYQSSPDSSSTSVPVDQARAGRLVSEDTSHLALVGLRHDPFDSYDPGEYDHNSPDYPDFSLNLIGNLLY